MGLNINLFVHGVPMGQKIWGPKGEDERYLSSFYGPKWETPEAMKIDVMVVGGVTQCYYSYIRGGNVCDSQGRAGSYFALTLRINAFYADAQNMYNILKASYEKMCVGLCVQETNSTIKYLLSDFKSVDNKLKEIEQHILNYISEFSIGNDIINLSGFPSNSQLPTQNINLHECTKIVATDIVKKTGKLMVSPWFLSAGAAKTIEQYRIEMQATAQKAQQEIKLQQQTSQREVAEITRKSKEELNTVREQSQKALKDTEDRYKQQLAKANEESEKKISSLKESYADVDAKIDALENEIKTRDKSISELKKQSQKKDKEIKGKDLQIQKLYQDNNKLQYKINSTPIDVDGNGSYATMPEPRRINWKIVSAVSFFTLLLIALLAYYAMSNMSKQKQIKTLKMEKVALANRVDSLQSVIESYASSSENLEIDSNNVEIAVTGIEHDQDQDVLYIGHSYPISYKIKGGEAIHFKKAYWKSEGLYFENSDSIIPAPQYDGKMCKLSFYIDGKVVKTKELLVKKKAQNEN